ncbi:MAG: class I SAM-dependent methyltransferase [Pseudomonadales bacterium]|nr:class I SAM-dependent methyltransferase [Pseudomonadales bacterium]
MTIADSSICCVCSSNNNDLRYVTHDRHYGQIDELYDVRECKDCGLLFLCPIPQEADLLAKYPQEDYYAYKKPDVSPNSLRKKLRRLIFCDINHERDLLKLKDGEVLLDMGCGNGQKLLEYKSEGVLTVGVEPSSTAAQRAQDAGLKVFHGTLFDVDFESESFDVVRCNHSFEHVSDPHRYLDEIFRILKPHGRLYLGLPNSASLQHRIFGVYWYLLGIPFHTVSYNPQNIRMLLDRRGFSTAVVKFNANAWGVAGSLQIWMNRGTRKTSKQGLMTGVVSRFFSAQIARVSNWLGMGDRMEVLAVKSPGESSERK